MIEMTSGYEKTSLREGSCRMSQLRLRRLESVEQLYAVRSAWDALWGRSEVTLPTARAELVALWLEHFAPKAAFRGLVVERQDGRFVAALPLVERRVKRMLSVGDLTWNYWSPNGELLVDPAADVGAALELLVGALAELPWPLLWFEMPPLETPRWKAMLAAMVRHGLDVETHRRYRIGTVDIQRDFEVYVGRLSKSLRRNVQKELRRLQAAGPVELVSHASLSPGDVERVLRVALEIEGRGWKGDAGQSVLKTPELYEFYLDQARTLAGWGCLRVSLLQHYGDSIAFELGWTGKGVYHSFKVGYDPAFARYSPGNLLRLHLIRVLHEEPGCRQLDFQGPMTAALHGWSTGSYPIGRVVVAPRKLGSRALLAGYRALVPVVRGLRSWTAVGSG